MQRYALSPLAGKYLCEIIVDLRQTKSGLFIAETVKEVPHRGKVLAAGKDVVDKKGKVLKQSAQVGDIVHFKRVWNRQTPKDKELIFIKEEEIVGVERCL